MTDSKIEERTTRRNLIDNALQEASWKPVIDFAAFVRELSQT